MTFAVNDSTHFELNSPLIRIQNLRVSFPSRQSPANRLRVLHGIDLDVFPDECLGLVGESGCGKSVTWLAVLGLLGQHVLIEGEFWLKQQSLHGLNDSELSTIRGKRIAMIFQDPASALNPVYKVGHQLEEALMLHRSLNRQQATAQSIRLMDQVHIPNAKQRAMSYPHELSGGMNQRIMIAMALAGEPELLIADEPTTALDVTIQAQILDLLSEVRRETKMAMVLISHDLSVIAQQCDRVTVMYAGRTIEAADAGDIFRSAHHPYTRGLIDSIPEFDTPVERLNAIAGQVPEPGSLTTGCSFEPRCQRAQTNCRSAMPQMMPLGSSNQVACFHPIA